MEHFDSLTTQCNWAPGPLSSFSCLWKELIFSIVSGLVSMLHLAVLGLLAFYPFSHLSLSACLWPFSQWWGLCQFRSNNVPIYWRLLVQTDLYTNMWLQSKVERHMVVFILLHFYPDHPVGLVLACFYVSPDQTHLGNDSISFLIHVGNIWTYVTCALEMFMWLLFIHLAKVLADRSEVVGNEQCLNWRVLSFLLLFITVTVWGYLLFDWLKVTSNSLWMAWWVVVTMKCCDCELCCIAEISSNDFPCFTVPHLFTKFRLDCFLLFEKKGHPLDGPAETSWRTAAN